MVRDKKRNKSSPHPQVPVNLAAMAPVQTKRSQVDSLKKELNRLKRTNSRLRKMENLRVDLTHMIIHDLKSPLAEVVANLSLLEDEALSPVQKDYLSSAIL
jgi:signal transduction histidine kinase